MGYFEVNGNLFSSEGLSNINNFMDVVMNVRTYYCIIFGTELMNQIDLYVDNATKDSGHTPVITPVFNKFLIIKLCVDADSSDGIIAFQFAHELMHYVFYAKYGIDKPHSDEREESICTAASLIILHQMYPQYFPGLDLYVRDLDDHRYKKGAEIAEQLEYDMMRIKELI